MSIEETLLRLGAAVICGGLLGIERGMKKRPAGMRTYILVCVGAALVMLTNQFMAASYDIGDPGRMGAQVISGIGFLGAGTIMVTGHNRVKGLTTAAGLWVVACLGLAIGVGYYAGAVIGCSIIMIVLRLLHSMEEKLYANAKIVSLSIEFKKPSNINHFIRQIKNHSIKIEDLEITDTLHNHEKGVAILVTVHLGKGMDHIGLIEMMESEVNGIVSIEEY